jgi:hypothetical protein
VERSLFLSAVESALALTSSDNSAKVGRQFVRQSCGEWLSRWPGDFRVRFLLAQAHALDGDFDPAVQYLLQVVEADPESTRSYQSLASILSRAGRKEEAAFADGCLFGLGAFSGAQAGLPLWADPLQTAIRLIQDGRWQEARLAAETVMQEAPLMPLPALVHLQAVWRLADYSVTVATGKEYRSRWPGCAAFLLLMAQSCFASGRNAEGVELLHAASVADPASEVADRYLGSLNPYRSLWPAKMDVELSQPVPADVAMAAGWNRLNAAPLSSTPPDLPVDIPSLKFQDFDSQNPESSPMVRSETIEPIPGERFPGPFDASDDQTKSAKSAPKEQSDEKAKSDPESELEDLRLRLHTVAARLRKGKNILDKDTRRPAYIIITSRKRLESIYGPDSMAEINARLADVLNSKRANSGWSAHLVDVEDRDNLQPFGLAPIDPSNAWQVKSLLAALDKSLGMKGEMIGALLIVGGHDVIPFHLLPNPTDDDDPDVPSDNPYSTRDENYFVPEWPVGRLPTPSDPHGGFLVDALRRIAEKPGPIRSTVLFDLISLILDFFHIKAVQFRKGSGCTAAIWRKASIEAFRLVAPADSLLVCPPVNSEILPPKLLTMPKYSYFNLHGMENGPQWLGQRDAKSKEKQDPEFPIVLIPSQVAGARKTPAVVFTEACYGANIQKKGIADSILLEFLAAGTRALVGSTKICYGATTPPLIAADLLARLFMQNCLSGAPVGEALRQAKLSLTQEMNRLQGFLDPEDQKTLISFILVGDPLFIPETATGKQAKQAVIRWRSHPGTTQTIRSKDDLLENGSVPSDNVQTALKKNMSRYLPGMSEGRMRFLHPRLEPDGRTSIKRGKKPSALPRSPAWVVSLDRKYQTHGQSLTQYAKISMDASGRVIKMVVSR